MSDFTGIFGIIAILGFCFLISNNRKKINYRTVIVGLLLQITTAIFVLKVEQGKILLENLATGIQKVIDFSSAGAGFVFGPLAEVPLLSKVFGNQFGFIFFFKVMPTVLFLMVLVNLAYHFGIMQRVVSVLAKIMHRLMKVSGSEALSNIGSSLVGNIEAQAMIRPYLKNMTKSELLASMTGSLACISGGVMTAFIAMGIPANYLIAATFMAAPGALVIAKIVYPETEESETSGNVTLDVKSSFVNSLDAIAAGAKDGMQVGLNITAMLIAFVGLIALVNYLISIIGLQFGYQDLNLQTILGHGFSVVAWLMGVPSQDIQKAGGLLGLKLVVNEFVAFVDMGKIQAELAPKTVTILTFALAGFANFGTIAVQIGGIAQLEPTRRGDLARLGMKALLCGTLASYLSASIAGLLM